MQTTKTLQIRKAIRVQGSPEDLLSLTLAKLEILGEYIPDIRSITPLRKTSSPGKVLRTDRWLVNADVPNLLKKVIGVREIAFVTDSSWDLRTNTITWTLHVEGFDAHVTGEGCYAFLPASAGATLEAKILLHFDLGSSRILRSALGRLVFSQLEKFASIVLASKMLGIGRAIEEFVADNVTVQGRLSAATI